MSERTAQATADRDAILDYLEELLRPGDFADYCPNGLQVPGRKEIAKVVTGVSATLELFEAAAELGADMVIAHHGIFWNGNPEALSEPQARRLKLLLGEGINLAAYHLPLDAHGEIGNNALLCEALGLKLDGSFGDHRGNAIGWTGRAAEPFDVAELTARVTRATGRDPLVFANGPDAIERIGVISGAAAGHLGEAIGAGLDAFITGEPAERVMAESAEAGIHFLAAGHYATETFGVRRIGELIAERFGVTHEFVDLPNPV
ncbi:MAG: Nif3-like dinuclear metal center hexameric protein [Actinobacteria bacterium]|nr:Nif3-like dinuclear metal center hexameric protein [Actinomycetota bacterium]